MNQGWTSRRRSGALGFGSCLHEGLAVWHRTYDIGAALLKINEKWPEQMPIDDWRTKEKCIKTMIEYSKHYPHETFVVVGMPDNPVIEVPFTLDTGMFLPCQHRTCAHFMLADWDKAYKAKCESCGKEKEPIEYGGIYDMLIEFSGHLYVVDHKTTSMMGPSYFNQFKPNNQMTGYIWAAGLMSGRKVAGAFINAIGMYKTGVTKFEREITSRSQAAIDEWLRNVWTECVNIITHKLGGYFPMRTGSCTQYGLCEYHGVHSLEHNSERIKRLETDYVQEKWDFENRD